MIKSQTPRPKIQLGHWTLFIVHWILFIILTACARPDDAWDRVRETGILRVGMDASFPPFETIAADGTLVGFDVDLARELGRRLGPALSADATSVAEGVEVQFVANLPYDGLYDALAVGRVDAVISALVANPARMGDFAYSTPYFDAGQVLVVCPPSLPPASGGEGRGGGIEEMADLSGYTLTVEFGTQGDLEARKWARRLSGLTVVPLETAAEALAQVAAGEADGALVDHVSALTASKTLGLVIVGEPVVEEPYAVAVRKESQHLLRAINEALEGMKADGTMETLFEEYWP
jgi:ABC-type amino acid transport substrate-binding protein